MFISMFEKVRILKTGVIGTIIDSYNLSGETIYIVESETDDGFDLIDCRADELSKGV